VKKYILYIKIAINLILLILGIVFVVFAVPNLIKFFLPFVIGWIISMIANPLVKFLEKKVKIVRKHSSAIIIIAVIAAIVAVIYGIISLIVNQVFSLMNDMPNIYQNIALQFEILSGKLIGIYKILPPSLKNFVDNFYLGFADYGSKIGTNVFSELPSISSAVNLFLMTIITILSAYFFIKERDNIARDIRKIVSPALINSYNIIVSNIKTAVGGYFRAQFKIMLILILILFIGFELIEVDYSFLLALVIAILDFLPFLGTGVVIWPWALVEFLLGDYGRAIFLIIIYLVCQVIKQVLQPKLVGDSIGISPLSTLIFMYIGYKFMNVFGMIIGIPIGMIIIKFYQMGMFDRIIRGITIIIHDINEFRKF
jgi:sporulation integral membrane protein YtvI